MNQKKLMLRYSTKKLAILIFICFFDTPIKIRLKMSNYPRAFLKNTISCICA